MLHYCVSVVYRSDLVSFLLLWRSCLHFLFIVLVDGQSHNIMELVL